MDKKWLIYFGIVIILLPQVLAFSTFAEEIQIHSDLSTTFLIEATTQETDTIVLHLPLESHIDFIEIDGETQDCDITEETDQTVITCSQEFGLHFLVLKASTRYPIIESEETFYFTLSQQTFSESASLKVSLPEGSMVSEERPIFLEPSSRFSVGNKEVLLWHFTSGQKMEVSFLATNPQTSNSSFILTTLFVITIIASLVVVYHKKLIAYSKHKKMNEPGQSYLDHLLDQEKVIIRALEEAEKNFLWQKELQLKTNLSKVQLSRTLRRMEERKLITKEPFASSNKISLVRTTEGSIQSESSK